MNTQKPCRNHMQISNINVPVLTVSSIIIFVIVATWQIAQERAVLYEAISGNQRSIEKVAIQLAALVETSQAHLYRQCGGAYVPKQPR